MPHRRLSRRQVLQLGAITGLAVACTPTATPVPTAQAVLPTLTPLPIQPTVQPTLTNAPLAVNTAAPTRAATATPAAELALIQAMTVAAQNFLNQLDDAQRTKATYAFDDAERLRWHYLWLDRDIITWPMVYAVMVGGLLAVRLFQRREKRRIP